MKAGRIYKSIIIILAFLFALYGRALLSGIFEPRLPSLGLRLLYVYAWWAVPVILISGFLFGFRNLFNNLGLEKGFLSGLFFSIVVVLPMFLGSAWLGELISDLNAGEIFRKILLAGFMEELLFRGFLFGLLFRKLKWGFIPASLPGALLFGFLHIYQGSGLMNMAGIFMITFIGALWFGWLYIEWDYNLWVPIWLHSLMNLSWALFFVEHNALGGFAENIFRFITIALTVAVTIWYCKRRKAFRINKSNLLINT